MFLLPPALAQGRFALRGGRGYLGALVLSAATLLVHLVSGYIALVSLAVLTLISPRSPGAPDAAQTTSSSGRVTRALRLVLLVWLMVLVTAYFLLPFWLDSAYVNRSVWENEEK
ncbi:MAG: hypothetical protein RMK79_05880 [Anaerolineae bacterium]|nr:hypothetical protein [Anaerolineae bacterium]